MTILYLYQYFGTPKGGWSTRVYEMTRRWVEEGHKVIVVTTLYDKSDLKARGFISKQLLDGIEVFVLNLELSNKHSLPYRVFTFLAYVIISIYFVLFTRYQVLVASSGPISIGFGGILARYLRKKPFVFEVRDLWPEGAIQLGLVKSPLIKKLSYWFEKLCYKAAHEIIALSPGMAQSIRDRYGYNNIHVIPNACDTQLFSQGSGPSEVPAWAANKYLFLYTGSLGVMDDTMQIARAAKELMDKQVSDIQLVILGDGQEKPIMEDFITKHKLSNIKLLGLRPKTEVVEWLSQATGALLVFKDIPVLNTSSPNKMFDAFAAGKPLIQTTGGWIKELIETEKCGLNVTPNHAREMAEAMDWMARHPQEVEVMSKNVLRLANNRFNRDLLAKEMMDILKRYE